MNFFMQSEYAVYSFCHVCRCRSVARLPGNSPGIVQLCFATGGSDGGVVCATAGTANAPTSRKHTRRDGVMADSGRDETIILSGRNNRACAQRGKQDNG